MRNLVFILTAAYGLAQSVPMVSELSCPNTPDGRQPYRVNTAASGDLRRVVLTGASAICNDGSPAEMYVRAARPGATEPDGPSANRWVIHFLGGGNCSTYEECATRWCGIGQWEGTLMTTRFSGDFRTVGGLLSRNAINRLGDRNQVLLKYCSSDNWQGRKSDVVLRSETDSTKAYRLHFQGANIVAAALDALERGVPGMPKLTDATDVLISGDSAGGTGARVHTDRIAARLRAANPIIRVRAQYEASFGPDFNGKQGFPAGDPRDPVYQRLTDDYNRIQVSQRNAQLDDSCLAAHPTAPYLCADDSYFSMNHITTPFFQMMDIQDPLIINGLSDAEAPFTPAQIAQGLSDQLAALTNIRNTAIERSSISAAPGVVARNCGVHVTWNDDDGFLGKRYRSGPTAMAYSYYDVLWNWMTGASPSVLLAPRPPSTPADPPQDSICSAKAPTAPAAPTIATVSSASYKLDAPVAPESIVATFGAGLATATATATTTPWPTTLGGLQVTVTDARGTARLAPLYYVSPTQLLYLIPAGTTPGAAQVAIGALRHTIQVAETAPSIYSASQNGQGVAAATFVRVSARGERTEGLLFDANTKAAVPIPVAAGDQIYLLLYGTGMRGGPATATVGDVAVPVAGPVAQGQYQGLDQINLGPLPLRIGAGQRQIVIRQGEALANAVTVTITAAR
jgi:uncharacterized protein (TIGR03437 family)